jgi:hypothetical protein
MPISESELRRKLREASEVAKSSPGRAPSWWLSDGGSRGGGRLVVKVTSNSATFYFRYFNGQAVKRHLFIAQYDRDGVGQLTTARDRAHELSKLYRGGIKDLHDHFEQLRAGDARDRADAELEAERARLEAAQCTLSELLSAYVGYLDRRGAADADDVRRLFRLHVEEASPDLARRRASDVPVPDFVRIIAALVAAGKGRTAGKLRSYLRAAYALALRSKTDPAAPIALQGFGIQSNPIASIDAKSLSRFNKPRTRTLQAGELGSFLRRLRDQPATPKRDALALCLLLGGQRPTQLLRLNPSTSILAARYPRALRSEGRATSSAPARACRSPARLGILASTARPLCRAGAPFFTNDDKRQLRIETIGQLVAGLAASDADCRRVSRGLSSCATFAARARRCWRASAYLATSGR